MLRMIGSNSGDFVCTQVLHNLWKLFLFKKYNRKNNAISNVKCKTTLTSSITPNQTSTTRTNSSINKLSALKRANTIDSNSLLAPSHLILSHKKMIKNRRHKNVNLSVSTDADESNSTRSESNHSSKSKTRKKKQPPVDTLSSLSHAHTNSNLNNSHILLKKSLSKL